MNYNCLVKVCIFTAITAILTGCAASYKNIPLDPNKEITFMPVIDARKDRSTGLGFSMNSKAELDASEVVYDTAKRELLLKGYEVNLADDFDTNTINTLQAAPIDVHELAKLGPPNSKKLLYVFVNDIDATDAVIYKTVKVDVSAILIDKGKQKIIWRNKLINSEGRVGVVAVLEFNNATTLSTIVTQLIKDIPDTE